MSPEEIIGSLAAVLTTTSFFPQAIRVLRTRDTGAISLTMYTLFTVGITLWGIYGLMTNQLSIIAANGITVVLAGLILCLKIRDVLAAKRKAGA